MAPRARRVPRIALLLALFAPQAAFAGSAVVTPFLAKGVEPKVSAAVTGLVSSELDFSGAYETVTELPQLPATLNAACLTQVSCLAAIAKAGGADAVLTGSVAPGSAGLQIQIVLYDGGKIKNKQTFETAGDPATLADSAGKWVKAVLSGAPAAATATAAAVPSFESEEEDFAFEGAKPAAAPAKPSKTRTENVAKPRELSDDDEGEEEEEAPSSADRSRSEAAERAKEEAEAKAAAEARAKAKAEAEARARADAEAKAKAKADAERRAREETERLAREEEEEDARREAARKAAEAARRAREEDEYAASTKAAASSPTKSTTSTKAAPKPAADDDEDFEFGSAAAEIEIEEEEEEDLEEEPPPARPTSTARTTTTSRTSTRPVVEEEDEPVEDEELTDLDEEAPVRSRDRDEDEEEEEERPSSRSRSSSSSDDEDEDSYASRSRSRSSDDDEDRPSSRSSSSRSSSSRSSSSSRDFDDLDGPTRPGSSSEKKVSVSLAGRVGYANYGDFNFLTYGGELGVGYSGVNVVAGLEGYSTQRQYGEEACRQLAEDAGVDPEDYDCAPWQTILPGNIGVMYKYSKFAVRPYGGVDLTVTPYTTVPDLAIGARARLGADFMVVKSFGFNLNLSLGFMSGEKLDQTQEGIQNSGIIPQVSAGTILVF